MRLAMLPVLCLVHITKIDNQNSEAHSRVQLCEAAIACCGDRVETHSFMDWWSLVPSVKQHLETEGAQSRTAALESVGVVRMFDSDAYSYDVHCFFSVYAFHIVLC